MQLFYFVLKTREQTFPDPEGQELAGESAARVHAATVAQQLMRNRELNTRNWRIQVCDDYLRPLFEVFFADVDETLEHLPPHLQLRIGDVVRTAAALSDAIATMRATLLDVRDTLSRADRILSSLPHSGHSSRAR